VPRGYSPELIESLRYKTARDGLGTVLAKKCIAANLPSTMVADLLDVSRQTLHMWFRGAGIQPEREPRIKALIAIIDSDIAAGVLPLEDYKSSKAYYKSLTGPA
jgi:hypothetical protein